jgi:hypothetical protein
MKAICLSPLLLGAVLLAATGPAQPASGPEPASGEAAWQRDRATDCAALAYVATVLHAPESAEGAAFTQRSALFSWLMAAHLQAADPTTTVTNGQVATAKSVRIDHLAWLYQTEPDEVLAVNRLCWEWAKGFGLAMASDPDLDPLTPVDVLRSPLDELNRAVADAILEEAMAAFAEHGITPAAASEGARRVPLQRE